MWTGITTLRADGMAELVVSNPGSPGRKNNALTLIFTAAMLAWRASHHVLMESASTP
jgi:hypothetical protein